jgi:hypothetical protein
MRRRLFAEPQALDPASGFKVPYRNLVRQWDGEFVDRRFVDKRNPQDMLKARPERPQLDHARPEPEDVFLAVNIVWEDGLTPIINADGSALLGAGPVGGEGL